MSCDSSAPTNQVPKRLLELISKTPILSEGDVEAKRAEILKYFHDSFSLYESLFECLKNDEAYYHRANRLRQPLIFYYGHTAVFFINKLNVANFIDQRVDPVLESSLAIGVDEMSWDDLNDDNFDWPTPMEVKSLRDKTRAIIDRFIRKCDFSLPIDWESPLWIIMMAIEHERIHLETSSVLIRELPIEMVQSHRYWGAICQSHGSAPENGLIAVEGGNVEMGKSKTNPLYGWDLEYGYSCEEVKSFQASKHLVSNQEFLKFVEADGYRNEEFWSEEGWKWIEFSQAKHPVYWLEQENGYRYRTMLNVIDMPWNWPAEINYLEAKAFCNWKSAETGKSIRMPTEAEWYRLREPLETDQPYWDKAPGNINLEYEMSPCPVDRHEFHDGLFDVIGNVWQWTETPVEGYDGYEVHPSYDDFSAPKFDGKHNIFKGGSWISTGNNAIKDARYAFRRHFFQISGLRYVEAAQLPKIEPNVYETDQMVSLYIDFHYGQTHLDIANFPVACIDELKQHLEGRSHRRALDIGCATARSSFELARVFDHVDAVDLSARLLEAPTNLQNAGKQRYVGRDEGELLAYREILLENFEGYEAIKHKISFLQGDACNLNSKFAGYDLVFAGNLLDRLYDPQKFLSTMKERINPGGLLVIVSPHNWSEAHTPRDKWLGGFKAETGESFTTRDGLAAELHPEFRLLENPTDIPFVIRETTRTFQYGVSEMTVWARQDSPSK